MLFCLILPSVRACTLRIFLTQTFLQSPSKETVIKPCPYHRMYKSKVLFKEGHITKEKGDSDMSTFREITEKLPNSMEIELKALPDSIVSEVEEIRLRCGQNIRLQCGARERILSHIVTQEDLQKL